MSATLVSTIPLPKPQVQTQNVLANESKGLTESKPKAEPKEEPKAIPIPERETKKKAPLQSTQRKPPPKEVAKQEDNKIPFGEGGPISGPYGSFTTNNAKGGLSFTGGTGDFGSRFGWYVDGVRRKVSENWMKYEIRESMRRVGFTFRSRSTVQDRRGTFAWSSPAACLRSISRRYARCRGSIRSGRFPRIIRGGMWP